MQKYILELNEVVKTFGKQVAVDRVSFTMKRGEIVGFLGPNGAGKSTLMRLIMGLLKPDSGKIAVDGKTYDEDPIHYKAVIGYLPELNPLYSEMYVREFLLFIAGLHHLPNAKKRVEEVIEMVGLTPESHKPIGTLSKGYKQRVGLAHAILHDPDLLILDEPTSGLDPNQVVEIRELIKMLGKKKTILFSSHILTEVESVADRVILIHKGRKRLDAPLQEIKSGHPQLVIKFEKGVEGIKEVLNGIPGIKWKMEGRRLNVWSSKPEVIQKKVYQWSVEQGNPILEMRKEEETLETIFRRVTEEEEMKA